MRRPSGSRFQVLRLLNSTEVFILSFALAILTGTFALMLPGSTTTGSIRFIDALFTATSAVCVTGLTVVDIGTYYTRSGQVIIMCLLQMGGLGIMTFSVILMLLSGRRISIRDKMAIQDALTPRASGEVYLLVRRLFLYTFMIEGAGAVLLWLFTPDKSWFASAFHAISAFCNAGFGLKPSNFMEYRYNIGVNLLMCLLIVLGGLGFFTHMDIVRVLRSKLKIRASLQTRLVLVVTVALIVGGAISFGVFESRNILRHEGVRGIFLISTFQSITARTAGFSTVDFGRLTMATLFMVILLMFVGASPGSTGGGIKTTTLGVLIAMAGSQLRGEEGVSAFRRCVPDRTVSKALSVLVLAISLVTAAVLVLAFLEMGTESYHSSRLRFIEVFFEVVSAFGTVGLSTGITPRLSSLGKFVLVLVMFAGRVGPLTIATVVGRQKRMPKYRHAEENVMVG